ncbi:hypothetical protein ACIBCA_20460 [Kitasatospora sp. NPDC051170]|uniref:DUF7848 domain-containing protein n=1 Tax=Kitasatospora sp. NPDC051170 TaxID=3364056 RepID=UPI0037BD0ED6
MSEWAISMDPTPQEPAEYVLVCISETGPGRACNETSGSLDSAEAYGEWAGRHTGAHLDHREYRLVAEIPMRVFQTGPL